MTRGTVSVESHRSAPVSLLARFALLVIVPLAIVPLVGVIVALPTGWSTAQAQVGFDRGGAAYTTFPVRSADPAACAARCERDARCRAWSFAYPTAEAGAVCRLKAQVETAKADPCCASGVKGAGVTETNDGGGEIGIDRAGGDYQTLDLAADASWPVCKAACEGESRCRAWTFLRAGYVGPTPRCYLKTRIPAPRKRPCCVSGVVK
ncbi:PAN domain-containing protein [Rhodoplanes azumiensis]|uniref:PAN domain-containing protein n=1 Tax=Rhodoplanes azumiensis TaxID=1897628 RepID=A0ABW5AED2_9BRAD